MTDALPTLTGQMMLEISRRWHARQSWADIADAIGVSETEALEYAYRMGIRQSVCPNEERRRYTPPWSDEKTRKFREAWGRREDVSRIGLEFGLKTGQVYRRAKALGLPPRNSTSKKAQMA